MLDGFGRVLRVRHVPWLVTTSVVARFPYAMETLAIVLFLHDRTGSFAPGGAVSAVAAVCAAIGLPVQGRAIDRLGQTRVLVVAAVMHGAAIALTVALGVTGAPWPALLPCAVVFGFFTPPLSPALRALWPRLLDERDLRVGLTLDAILLDVIFTIAPLIAAATIALASPAAALALSGAFAFLGTLAFATAGPSRTWRPDARGGAGGRLGPLRVRGLQTLLLAALPIGCCFGALDVALPAFAVSHDVPSLGGVVIAVLSVGSVAGGLLYGALAKGSALSAYFVLLLAMPLGVALLAVPDDVWLMLLLAPVAGAVLAPLTAVENELVGIVTPDGMVTEAYSWIITAAVSGISIGVGLGGVIADAVDWRATILFAAGFGVVGAAVSFARRATLRPPAGVPVP